MKVGLMRRLKGAGVMGVWLVRRLKGAGVMGLD